MTKPKKRNGPPERRRPLLTHCHDGHELTDENVRVYYRNGRPERQCRLCQARREKDAYRLQYVGGVDFSDLEMNPLDDIPRETAMPWERNPIPWDNVTIRSKK